MLALSVAGSLWLRDSVLDVSRHAGSFSSCGSAEFLRTLAEAMRASRNAGSLQECCSFSSGSLWLRDSVLDVTSGNAGSSSSG